MHFRKAVWLRRFHYTGEHRYSLTLCTHARRQVFVNEAAVREVRSHFLQAAQREQVAIAAYCFMPDHLHLLAIGLAEASDAKRFVALGKQLSGYHFARVHGHRLWQRYSWDRILRSADQTLDVVCYLLANPVRAGLATRPLDYPFSGSELFERDVLESAFEERSAVGRQAG